MSRLEDKLQIAIVDMLKLKALPSTIWFAVPNGIPASPKIGARFKAMGLVAGVADMCVIADNSLTFIEVKADKGRLSDEQKAFKDKCDRLQIPYCIVRSLDEAERVLWGAGALKGPPPQAVRSAA